MRFNLSVFLAVVLGLGCLPAHAENTTPKGSRFFSVLEGEALGGYSQVEDHSGEFASIDRWLFSPNWKLRDDLLWINVYNGDYNRSSQVVAQEEGGRQTNETMSHNLSTALRYSATDTWSLTPTFFAGWNFVNETNNESFGDGLYDYDELGGGIESQWTTLKTSERQDDVRFGFRYVRREYPNYQSLLSIAIPGSTPEVNEKDLDGYKFNLSHDTKTKNDWSWGLEGIFFYKDYTDKQTIDNNGVRTGDTREDFVEYVNAYAQHPLGGGWRFRLDGQMVFNQSNLDFLDTHNNGNIGDDEFVGDYFDYNSYLVKPSFTYTDSWSEGRTFTATLDYTFYVLDYQGRKVQNSAGRYLEEGQVDYQHTASAKVSVPVTPNLSWVTFGSYTVAESNQTYEAFYLYEYNLWTAVTGISLKY